MFNISTGILPEIYSDFFILNQFKPLNISFTQQILQINQSVTKNFNELRKL